MNSRAALDAHRALLAVEDSIEQRFPRVYRGRFPSWVRRDTSLIHADDQVHPSCRLCRQQPLNHQVATPLPQT